MIAWILKELQKNPTSLFRKKDLLKKSKKQFEKLKRQGLLTYVQPALYHETYPCSLVCNNTCPMEVVEMENRIFAICPQNAEVEPIPIEKDDLNKYAFNINRLLEQIRAANEIGGNLHRINESYSYIGYKTYDGNRVGFVFISKIANVGMLELSGLNQLCEDDDILVVLTPASKIEDVSLKGMLRDKKIVQSSLVSSVNLQTFELPIETLISGILKPKTEQKTKPVKEATKGIPMQSNFIPCVEIAGIIRKRSDAIARTLRAAKYPVVKKANKNYCDPEHAAVLFPKWKKHLKRQQENE